jgi:hypothetical protein
VAEGVVHELEPVKVEEEAAVIRPERAAQDRASWARSRNRFCAPPSSPRPEALRTYGRQAGVLKN